MGHQCSSGGSLHHRVPNRGATKEEVVDFSSSLTVPLTIIPPIRNALELAAAETLQRALDKNRRDLAYYTRWRQRPLDSVRRDLSHLFRFEYAFIRNLNDIDFFCERERW